MYNYSQKYEQAGNTRTQGVPDLILHGEQDGFLMELHVFPQCLKPGFNLCPGLTPRANWAPNSHVLAAAPGMGKETGGLRCR